MDSSASKVGSEGINLRVSAPHSPSKLKTYGFAIAIIVGIGGLAVGAAGLAGFFHVGALSNIAQVNAIIMMAAGGGGGIILLIVGVVGTVKTRQSGSRQQHNDVHVDPERSDSTARTDLEHSERQEEQESPEELHQRQLVVLGFGDHFEETGFDTAKDIEDFTLLNQGEFVSFQDNSKKNNNKYIVMKTRSGELIMTRELTEDQKKAREVSLVGMNFVQRTFEELHKREEEQLPALGFGDHFAEANFQKNDKDFTALKKGEFVSFHNFGDNKYFVVRTQSDELLMTPGLTKEPNLEESLEKMNFVKRTIHELRQHQKNSNDGSTS